MCTIYFIIQYKQIIILHEDIVHLQPFNKEPLVFLQFNMTGQKKSSHDILLLVFPPFPFHFKYKDSAQDNNIAFKNQPVTIF